MSARRPNRIPSALPASFQLTSIPALAAVLLGALALGGCGQMGPLVLPGSEGAEGATSSAGDDTASGSEFENEDGDESGGENEQ